MGNPSMYAEEKASSLEDMAEATPEVTAENTTVQEEAPKTEKPNPCG